MKCGMYLQSSDVQSPKKELFVVARIFFLLLHKFSPHINYVHIRGFTIISFLKVVDSVNSVFVKCTKSVGPMT